MIPALLALCLSAPPPVEPDPVGQVHTPRPILRPIITEDLRVSEWGCAVSVMDEYPDYMGLCHNDMIVSITGHPVNRVEDWFLFPWHLLRPGAAVDVLVVRRCRFVIVTIKPRPVWEASK